MEDFLGKEAHDLLENLQFDAFSILGQSTGDEEIEVSHHHMHDDSAYDDHSKVQEHQALALSLSSSINLYRSRTVGKNVVVAECLYTTIATKRLFELVYSKRRKGIKIGILWVFGVVNVQRNESASM